MRDWEADFEAFMLDHTTFFTYQAARYCNLNGLPVDYRGDLLQDAVEQMLRMWEGKFTYEPQWRRRAAMCQILQYKAMNAKRRRATEAEHRISVSPEATDELLTDGVSAESIAIAEIARLEVYRQVQKLSSRQRQVVELRYLSGLTNREIAELLEISESAVTTSLCKAGRKLRTLISSGLLREFEAARFMFGEGGGVA